MKKAYIFDYDDTLVQTRRCKFAALKHLASTQCAIQLSDADIEAHWGKEYRTFFTSLFSGIPCDIDELIQRYGQLNSEFPMQAYEESIATLDALAPDHFVGLVTAAGKDIVLEQLRRMGFPMSSLHYLQFAEDTRFHKPDPRVFDALKVQLDQQGIDNGLVTYVGDGLHDYQAAVQAGFRFMGIAREPKFQTMFSQAGVPYITRLTELVTPTL